MAEQVRERTRRQEAQEAAEEVRPASDEEIAAKLAAIDDLLDEIDGIVEENAQEFVQGYVQKGGE
jgi:ubiquitin-like protein Pup